jgi:hypothetical protein
MQSGAQRALPSLAHIAEAEALPTPSMGAYLGNATVVGHAPIVTERAMLARSDLDRAIRGENVGIINSYISAVRFSASARGRHR